MLYGIRTGVCFILIFMLVKSYAEIRSQEVAFCRDCPTVWSSYPIEHGNESFLRFGYWEHSYRIVKTGTVNGQGTFTYANGDKYVGQFKDQEYHGRGYKISGSIVATGMWEEGKLVKGDIWVQWNTRAMYKVS